MSESDATLLCPVCRQALRVERKEKLEAKVCPDHGVWLDKGGIEAITQAVSARVHFADAALTRVAVRKAKEDGEYLGTVFGWLSLLFR
jgi:Zn-finger nucleic acid-binding protein